MPDDKWTIQNNPSPNPQLGNDLNGMKIEKIASGYRLVAVLATTTNNQPPFTFSNIEYDDQTWTIAVQSLAGSNSGGTWTAVSSGGSIMGDQTDGSFTAQGGVLEDEDTDAAASSSASA